MEVVALNKADFLKKVYNYEANPNDWKFEGSRPAIVDFYATWCGPCKVMHPILEELSKEYSGKVDIYQIDVEAGFYSLIPSWSSFDITAISKTFGQCFNIAGNDIRIVDFIVIIFAFLFVDMFDTLGTLIGVANKADMLDEDGKLPRIREALLADAIATSAGAVLGTSTTTTFVESSSGVSEGGRTGLASIVTGLLFLLAIVFAPVFTTIPGFATAPALIFVGFLRVSAVTEIDFNDFTEAIPAYLCLIAMPLMYSISEGIAVGVISYAVINLICGKKEKITPLMYVLAVLFVLKYIFL